MFETSLDILYMSLALGFILVSIFLCVALVYLTLILRDTSKASSKVRKMVDEVNEYIMKPIFVIQSVKAALEPLVQKIWDSVEGKDKKKK
jgi:hypothetical protein